jgi:hypothetical protein
MKILNLCFQDMAGSAYTLSHAINKHTSHNAINLISTATFAEHPSFAQMQDYSPHACRQMTEKADVIIFHSAVLPYYQGLSLSQKVLEDKKKFLYFHGSEARFYGKELIAQADEYMKDYTVLVSTPDLLLGCPKEAEWLPVTRSFNEIRRIGLSDRDKQALESFCTPKERVIFSHAPSDENKKGSKTFYSAMTRLLRELPTVAFTTIRNQPWQSCLRLLSGTDVYLDQDPPFAGAYGVVSVEASIFNVPCVCKMQQPVIEIINKVTGLHSPFITFTDEEELKAKLYLLATDKELREKFGNLTHDFCKQLHDEKPVVDKFMKLIGDEET